MDMNRTVILAGGAGTRMGGCVPKQFINVNGKPLLQYSLEAVRDCECAGEVWIVAGEPWRGAVERMIKEAGISSRFRGFCDPGPERQVSVMNALTELMKEETAENSYVMVHDGARPLVSGELIRRCFEAAAGRDGAVPVLPVRDTVYRMEDGRLSGLLKRDQLAAGQAPEVFRLKPYYDANLALMPDQIMRIRGSAEPAVLAGMDIVVIPADERNIKITTQEDLAYLRYLLGGKE